VAASEAATEGVATAVAKGYLECLLIGRYWSDCVGGTMACDSSTQRLVAVGGTNYDSTLATGHEMSCSQFKPAVAAAAAAAAVFEVGP